MLLRVEEELQRVAALEAEVLNRRVFDSTSTEPLRVGMRVHVLDSTTAQESRV